MGRNQSTHYRSIVRYGHAGYVWSQDPPLGVWRYQVLAVRGVPPDHSNCPKECSEAPKAGGKGKKK